MGHPSQIQFQPYYCEENAWRLCGHPYFGTVERQVVFITNPIRQVAFAGQRAAPRGQWVIWDYHVVFMTNDGQWRIWDPDARCGLESKSGDWLDAAFPNAQAIPSQNHPWFRVVSGDEFLQSFRSNRSHMRDLNGDWLQPPPPWPAPSEATNLMQFATIPQDFLGDIYSLKDFTKAFRA